MPEHLLLVEDDQKLAALLQQLLQGHGWRVTHCETGELALQTIDSLQPDLVILDIMLPGIDGIEVCKRIRQTNDCKILMLTALGADADQILGLEVGADDYLVKTAPSRLLLARIKALLRRGNNQADESNIINLGWCRIELQQQRLWLKQTDSPTEQEVMLSSAEFEVLAILAQQAGNIVSREELFQKALPSTL